MFGIMIYTDEQNKRLVFRQRANYFETKYLEDWTDKLDMTKDFVIQPVIADSKYLLFNHDEAEDDYLKKY